MPPRCVWVTLTRMAPTRREVTGVRVGYARSHGLNEMGYATTGVRLGTAHPHGNEETKNSNGLTYFS
jgi:hypothetical protein